MSGLIKLLKLAVNHDFKVIESIVTQLQTALINISYFEKGGSELLFYKDFLSTMFKALDKFSEENEFCLNFTLNTFWILSNTAFDGNDCVLKILYSNIYKELNKLYDKKLNFFTDDKFKLELATLLHSLCN